VLSATGMPSLYFHVPFCRTKCPYCDFFSIIAHPSEHARYQDFLLRHLSLSRQSGRLQTPLSTVFFGGGTPSLLTAGAVAVLLEDLAKAPGILPSAEISLEANPGTVNLEKLQAYRAAGVNRLSLGVQSLNKGFLMRLGRIHTPEQAVEAFQNARKAGFVNLSCDLMFGLPDQKRQDLLDDLDALLGLQPEHLSCYGLTVEKGTPFHPLHCRGDLLLPGEEECRASYLAIHDRLVAAGYRHYEISNYALPGHECRHNLVYWRRQPFLGIGAGAHSFFADGWGARWAVPSDLAEYYLRLKRGEEPAQRLESFDRGGAMSETLYLGLRTAEGVSEQAFAQRFGQGVADAFPEAAARCGRHLALEDGRWRMDLNGWLIYDHLITAFL
jgi:oxygen-independent coproporphyrinogen III oxidase